MVSSVLFSGSAQNPNAPAISVGWPGIVQRCSYFAGGVGWHAAKSAVFWDLRSVALPSVVGGGCFEEEPVKTALYSIVAVAVLASPAMAEPYTFGGVAGGASWNWEGIGMNPFRAAIANPTNFGPAGTLGVSASTTLMPGISSGTLAGINCFVAPANHDSLYAAGSVSAIQAWFLSGGDLLLMNDGVEYDAIGEALGVPSFAGNTSSTNGAGVGFTGPFGNAATINHAGLGGFLSAAGVVGTGGTVLGSNSAGPTAAVWDRGAFGPNSGKLVIVCDVDAFAGNELGYPGMANYASMNANAVFSLNVAAYFVPAPGATGLLAVAGLATIRRRR